MGGASGAGRAGSSRWRRIGVRVLYGLLAAAAIYVLVRNLDSPNDYANFVPFGRAALAGLNPYDPEVAAVFGRGHLWSTWPPAFAPVAVLLARLDTLLGTPVTILLWHGANLLALVLLLAFCARWLYDRPLSLELDPDPDRLPVHSVAALAGLIVPARLVLSNFEHSQSNLLFLGLAVAGFWLLREGRRWSGGLAFGLATSFKATPLVLVPYLVWRGRWRDLGAALAGCGVAWLVLPSLIAGPDALAEWYGSWIGFVGSLDLPLSPANQSLQGALTRILVAPEAMTIVGEGRHAAGAGPLGSSGVAWLVPAIAALLGLGAAVAFGIPGRQVPRRREALELGVGFAAMGLFSPIAWKFHYVGLTVLAAALYARTGQARHAVKEFGLPSDGDGGREWRFPAWKSRLADPVWMALALAFLTINLTATGLIGGAAADFFEWHGVVTWPALLLVMVALWTLWRERRRRTDPSGQVDAGAETKMGSAP